MYYQSGGRYYFANLSGWSTDASTMFLIESYVDASLSGDWSEFGYDEHPTDVSFYNLSSSALIVGKVAVPFFHAEFLPEEYNDPPEIDAGFDQTITLGQTAILNGTVTDDGLPSWGILTSTWSKISGPGTVTFGNSDNPDTTASFSAYGIYVLQLTATAGQHTVDDTLIITVNPESLPDLPPDPVSAAPPLDPTIATTLADSTRFLYTGANPIQRGMDEDTIRAAHVAVMKGYVYDRDGDARTGYSLRNAVSDTDNNGNHLAWRIDIDGDDNAGSAV